MLTLSVLFRVMHGEEQRERGADRLLAAATQTAVLHFTSEQFSDGRLSGGTQRTESSIQGKQTSDYMFMSGARTCHVQDLAQDAQTSISVGCRPAAGPPVGLGALLLLCLLVELGEDEAVPALD